MDDLTSPAAALLGPAEIRALADELHIRPTKKLGQNFVHDANTVRRIVAAAKLDSDDVVLEVAPGVEVRYIKRAIMEVLADGEEETETFEDDEPGSFHDDEDETSGTDEDSHDVKSAEDGLADSHDDLAKSDKDNVH